MGRIDNAEAVSLGIGQESDQPLDLGGLVGGIACVEI